MTQRIALGVCYNGRGWDGFQSQPSRRTIQDILETALAEFATLPAHIVCAGRTDAGVHAIGQVVHFDVDVTREPRAWIRGTNRFLPESIAVQWMREVPSDFHARFDALSRTYYYVMYVHATRSPLAAGRAGWTFRELDLALMVDAALVLLGERDFSAFRSSECQARSPVRTLM